MKALYADERELFARVLRLWTRNASQTATEPRLRVLTESLRPVGDWVFGGKMTKAALPLEIDDRTDGLLIGPTVNEGYSFRPVASVRLMDEDGGLNVCIRVASVYLNGGQLAADGYRFESRELKESAPHPWSHVQRTTRWHKDESSFLDVLDPRVGLAEPEAIVELGPTVEVNEVRPAIPLGCHTAAGLALAMIGSFHGVSLIETILDQDTILGLGLDPRDRAYLLPHRHVVS